MKKAFCEPGNVNFCPPIALASEFAIGSNGKGSLTVKRSPENGGDREYTSAAEMERNFADGSLHPGDLKAATTSVMVDLLDKVSTGLKSDEVAAKATKDLKAFQKKLSKMKK